MAARVAAPLLLGLRRLAVSQIVIATFHQVAAMPPQVAATFLAPPLVGLAAFSSLHFLELLVGPKAAGLSIKDPEKLGELG